MITMTVDAAASQSAAVHNCAIFGFLDIDTQRSQSGGHGRDPVAFLDAQLTDSRKDRLARCSRSRHEQHRKLVDRQRHQRRIDPPPLQFRRADTYVGNGFLAERPRIFEAYVRTHGLPDINNSGSRRIDADIANKDIRFFGQ